MAGVPVPAIQQDADVRADIAAEGEHVGHLVDEGVLLALAQRLGTDEFQAQADAVFPEDLRDGFESLDVKAAVLLHRSIVGAGHDPGERAIDADGGGGFRQAREGFQVTPPVRFGGPPIDRQTEGRGADAGVGELFLHRIGAVLIDRIGDLRCREFQTVESADPRGRQPLLQRTYLYPDSPGTERLVHARIVPLQSPSQNEGD
jgi:hypothetical protein